MRLPTSQPALTDPSGNAQVFTIYSLTCAQSHADKTVFEDGIPNAGPQQA